MTRLSASSLWRAKACPASAALPVTPRLYEDAVRGRDEHATLEKAPPEGGLAEVAFAFDVANGTARVLGQALDRDYSSRGPNEIVGTADVVFIEPTRVRVLDYKTGYGYDAAVAPPAQNLQLRFLALCAARAHGKPAARVEIERTDTGEVKAADLDAFDLAETAEDVRGIWRAVQAAECSVKEGRTPKVESGEHCWRCACIQRCPAYTGLAVAMATGTLDVSDRELTVERIAAAWPRYEAAKRLFGEFDRAVRVFISHNGPVPLGDKLLDEREFKRESLDGKVAHEVIATLHGQAYADAACEVSTSKAAIERALVPLATKRGDKARLLKGVLDTVRAAGGVTVKVSRTLDVFNAALPPKE